ncbi:MAG: flavodoxin family protein [Spirochaetales bacterium]|nr:flavodoxin family protein [Spirochaetales bacterium]
MKTIFDLRDNHDSEIYKSIQDLYDEKLRIFQFGDDSINACTGCWSCWLKTPGRCIFKDRMVDAYSDYINSDTVILLIDTAQGFINHKAKAFLDRIIPLYHPYIEIGDGECHHVARYKSYPDMVFFYEKKMLTAAEDQVIEDYLYRTAYHFKSKPFRIEKNPAYRLTQLYSRAAKRKSLDFATSEPMEKLVIYNGSPRKKGSNSALILKSVEEILGSRVEVRDLKETANWDRWADEFLSEKNVMIFMPLYVHSMPSHVMAFIEKLQPSAGNISFFVQSGFIESSQSHFLEAYFEQLSVRLQRNYLGTAIKGGVEGLQIRPPKMQKKFIKLMVQSIVELVLNGKFNPQTIARLAKPLRLGWGMKFLFKILSKTSLVNFFWDSQLKANQVFEQRFDAPYLITDGGDK